MDKIDEIKNLLCHDGVQVRDLELPTGENVGDALDAMARKIKPLNAPLESDRCEVDGCKGKYRRQTWSFGPYKSCDICKDSVFLRNDGNRL